MIVDGEEGCYLLFCCGSWVFLLTYRANAPQETGKHFQIAGSLYTSFMQASRPTKCWPSIGRRADQQPAAYLPEREAEGFAADRRERQLGCVRETRWEAL